MNRAPRSELVRSRITKEMREEIEADLQQTSSVLSLSDWLFEAAEERLARRTIRVDRSPGRRRMTNT